VLRCAAAGFPQNGILFVVGLSLHAHHLVDAVVGGKPVSVLNLTVPCGPGMHFTMGWVSVSQGGVLLSRPRLSIRLRAEPGFAA
jgi:hypothetical protein